MITSLWQSRQKILPWALWSLHWERVSGMSMLELFDFCSEAELIKNLNWVQWSLLWDKARRNSIVELFDHYNKTVLIKVFAWALWAVVWNDIGRKTFFELCDHWSEIELIKSIYWAFWSLLCSGRATGGAGGAIAPLDFRNWVIMLHSVEITEILSHTFLAKISWNQRIY